MGVRGFLNHDGCFFISFYLFPRGSGYPKSEKIINEFSISEEKIWPLFGGPPFFGDPEFWGPIFWGPPFLYGAFFVFYVPCYTPFLAFGGGIKKGLWNRGICNIPGKCRADAEVRAWKSLVVTGTSCSDASTTPRAPRCGARGRKKTSAELSKIVIFSKTAIFFEKNAKNNIFLMLISRFFCSPKNMIFLGRTLLHPFFSRSTHFCTPIGVLPKSLYF